MRRLLRILFRAATIVSAVLCLAAAAGWVRSYWRGDDVVWSRIVEEADALRHDQWWFESAAGSVAVWRAASGIGYTEPPRAWKVERQSSDAPKPPDVRLSSESHYAVLGAQYGRWRTRVVDPDFSSFIRRAGWAIVLPYWMPTTALALLPAVAIVRGVAGRRRRRRAAGGLCPACGYDCRVTSAGGRCPECGAVQGGRGGGMKDEG